MSRSPWSTEPLDVTRNGKRCGYRRDLTGDDLKYEMTLLVDKLERGDVLRVPLAILGGGEISFGPFGAARGDIIITLAPGEVRFIRL